SSRRRHTRSTRDWSSDVCSSDLQSRRGQRLLRKQLGREAQRREVDEAPLVHVMKGIPVGLELWCRLQELLEAHPDVGMRLIISRSEERRVGKECRLRWRAWM